MKKNLNTLLTIVLIAAISTCKKKNEVQAARLTQLPATFMFIGYFPVFVCFIRLFIRLHLFPGDRNFNLA